MFDIPLNTHPTPPSPQKESGVVSVASIRLAFQKSSASEFGFNGQNNFEKKLLIIYLFIVGASLVTININHLQHLISASIHQRNLQTMGHA